MPRRVIFSEHSHSINKVVEYHRDTASSIRLYFSTDNPSYRFRFFGYSVSEIEIELADRLNETDVRSAFAILVRIEAAFRIDYLHRCQERKRDSISRAFRSIHKIQGPNVRLEQDILGTWRKEQPSTSLLVGEIVGAFKFRHWLAHGRYWTPKLGRKYDYQDLYVLADSVSANFPLYSAL